MKNQINVICPHCNNNVIIEVNEYSRYNCPHCNNDFEFDGRVKKSSSGGWVTFIVLIIGFYFAYEYYFKEKYFKEKSQLTIEEVKTEIEKFRNEEDLKKLKESVDIENPITNDYAVRLASMFPGEYNIGQVCNIFDYIVTNWKYVNDSDKMENIRSASRSINNGLAGDCDDFSVLIAAMIESIGGDARISFAYDKEGKGHAFTEILASNSKEEFQQIVEDINLLYNTNQFEIYYLTDKDGRIWINLDWWSEPQHPGGKYYDYVHKTVFYPKAKNARFEVN